MNVLRTGGAAEQNDSLVRATQEAREHWEKRAARASSDLERVDQSARAQRMRFEAFLQGHDITGKRILDVGCGVAALYAHLKRRAIPVEYLGIDIVPEMIRRSQERYPQARFLCQDILAWETDERFDYVISIGIHNVVITNGLKLLESITRRQFELCRIAAYVSILTERYQKFGPGVQAWAPEKILELALSITPYVTLRHDYLPNDFSIALYRQPLIDARPDLLENLER